MRQRNNATIGCVVLSKQYRQEDSHVPLCHAKHHLAGTFLHHTKQGVVDNTFVEVVNGEVMYLAGQSRSE